MREEEEASVTANTFSMSKTLFLVNLSSKIQKHFGNTTITLTLGFMFTEYI